MLAVNKGKTQFLANEELHWMQIYEKWNKVDAEGVIKPQALYKTDAFTAIIMDNPGGVLFSEAFPSLPIELSDVFSIMSSLATTITELWEHRQIHLARDSSGRSKRYMPSCP
jgi:hypothetical protein